MTWIFGNFLKNLSWNFKIYFCSEILGSIRKAFRKENLCNVNSILSFLSYRFDKFSDFVDFSWNDLSRSTKDLVSTFNLTADNIVLHPSGWMVATGILIHFLATKSDSPLKNGLEQPFMKQLSSKMTYGGKHVSIFVDELMNLAW